MKIGDRVYVHGRVDEIRKDTVIIRNEGGFFGTDPSEVITEPELHWIPTSKERPPQHQEIWITDDLGTVELVYGKDGIWWLDDNYYTEPEIIAWMHANVPSPYQPEEESE